MQWMRRRFSVYRRTKSSKSVSNCTCDNRLQADSSRDRGLVWKQIGPKRSSMCSKNDVISDILPSGAKLVHYFVAGKHSGVIGCDCNHHLSCAPVYTGAARLPEDSHRDWRSRAATVGQGNYEKSIIDFIQHAFHSVEKLM
jgi:hypothetical protein